MEEELLYGLPDGPDPDLDETLLECIEDVLFNNSFQFVESMEGGSQDLFIVWVDLAPWENSGDGWNVWDKLLVSEESFQAASLA